MAAGALHVIETIANNRARDGSGNDEYDQAVSDGAESEADDQPDCNAQCIGALFCLLLFGFPGHALAPVPVPILDSACYSALEIE